MGGGVDGGLRGVAEPRRHEGDHGERQQAEGK